MVKSSVPCGAAQRGLTRNSVQIRSSPAAVNGDEGADATVFMGRNPKEVGYMREDAWTLNITYE